MKMDNSKIDPEIRKISTIAKLVPHVFTKKKLKVFNQIVDIAFKGKCRSDSLTYEQHWIKRKDGGMERVCIYKPKDVHEEKLPGLLWIHGGGYGMGSPELDENFIKNFIETAQCVVIVPEYRLSIEKPFPAALDDCYAALLWMKHNADKLGIHSSQLMIGGDSAGGGLTAALSLYARDRGTVNISFQMPLYPMLDDRMITESSQNNTAPVWDSKRNYLGWKYYLGGLFESDHVSKYAAPSRETDYSNLPPTCTFVGSLEVFRDETIQYIEKLRAAGVATHFKEYKGCYHGFDQAAPEGTVAKEATRFLLETFQYAINHYFAEQKK